ncbi:LamG domain-containing protein [archaeon AH-315-M20]|nr:LamG domain-containing protein [archaeon AH-315-M20]
MKEFYKKRIIELMTVYIILALALVGIYYLEPTITGLITGTKQFSYSDSLSLVFNESSDYILELENLGNLKSIKVSGTIENKGSAKIYIENKGVRYLIFDSDKLNEKEILDKITGFVIAQNDTINETLIINITPINITNETINITPILNETTNITPITNITIINETIEINKSIKINLEYKVGTNYDVDDNGIETTTGIIDLTVESSKFNWDVDSSNLCTRWETFSIENQESTFVCYGSSNCCALVNLKPTRVNWSDTFHSYYGLYGATLNNIISSQVIYADYNLSVDEPYAEIIYSDISNLSAIYYTGLIAFNDICLETCSLFDFNSTSYKLIFEINNTVLNLNEIDYIIEKEVVVNNPPVLIRNISNITIIKNQNYTFNLNDYFYDQDNDSLFFDYYRNVENISVYFDGDIATIVPANNFVGTRFMFFKANDSTDLVVSNVFKISVESDITLNITPKIISKKKDFKFDEDIDLDFEYLEKEVLVKQGKWKEEYEVYEEETEKTKEELELLREKIKEEEKLLSEAEKLIKKQKKKFVKENEAIETFVFDSRGTLTTIEAEIEELREGKFKIKLPKQRQFRAGKYKIKLELIKDGITYVQEQDFTWGVLAINVNKSIYLENEDSFIGIGVLDDKGKIVCDADVTLEITDPLNQKTILTTTNNDIKISPECEVLGVTELPDYYTDYTVSGIGTYIMNLTAITANGVRNIQDNFSVQSSVDFDVARKGPTRIYPKVPYNMRFTINANKNYNGLINEFVPAGFEITPQNGLVVTEIGDTKVLSWDVKLKQGDTINLYYEFDAPDVSPEFYLLGALDVGSWQEIRQWQIASDAPVAEATIERTATTEKICMDRKCTLAIHSGSINYYNGSEFLPIETTIVASSDILFDYEVTKGAYHAFFKTDPTAGQVVKYVANNTEITFQPLTLNFRNDLDQLQQIATVSAVFGVPNANEFLYEDAYGAGIDLKYTYHETMLKEGLILYNFTVLPEPQQFIKDGGNPTLDIGFVLDTNAQHIVIEGTDWDKKTTTTTQNEVLIKDNNGNILYKLPKPVARDSNTSDFEEELPTLTYQFKKQGNKLHVIIKTPYDWLNASHRGYPVTIDPTIELQDAGTENTGDAGTRSDIGNADRGTCTALQILDTGSVIANVYLRFNWNSQIPAGATIDGANLSLRFGATNFLDAGESQTLCAKHVYPFNNFSISSAEWTEGDACAGAASCTGTELCSDTQPDQSPTSNQINTTEESCLDFDSTSSTATRYNWTVTDMFKREFAETIRSYDPAARNITIEINTTLTGGTPSLADRLEFDSKEVATAANRPILYVVYTDRTPPAFSNRQPTNDTTIIGSAIQFNITITEVGGNNANITQLWTNASGGIWALNQSDNWTDTGKHTFNVTDFDVGFLYWAVFANDSVGNFNWTQNFSITFTSSDTTNPIIKSGLNKSTDEIIEGDVINATFNVTDNIALDTGQVIINDTGFNRFFNFTLSGVEAEFSQNFTVSCSVGCVINVTGRANDTSGNLHQNETVFTLVAQAPVIHNNYTIPLFPKKDENVTFYANVSDVDNNINSVNFTVIDPTGTKVVNNVNSSNNGQDNNWNITYNVSSYGTWLWNISIFDSDGSIVNSSTGTIILMELTESLNDTTVTENTNDPIAVSGHINLSNGTNVSNTKIAIWVNGIPANISKNDLTFNATILESTSSDWGSGTVINVTINADNITLSPNGSNQYPNQTGNFTSRVIDTETLNANFTFISWSQEVPYQTEIGRASGDNNDATDEDGFINTSGLLLLMHFNNETGENDSLFKDFSVDVNTGKTNNSNGTCSGNRCPFYNFSNKKLGRAGMEFDGLNDFINVSSHTSFDNMDKFTLVAWIYPGGAGRDDTGRIFDKNQATQGWIFFTCGPTVAGCDSHRIALSQTFDTTDGDWGAPSNSLKLNTWQHVAVTYERDATKDPIFYIDGEAVTVTEVQTPSGTPDDDSSLRLSIGGLTEGAIFNGTIDEIAIWNRTLSAKEIRDLYKRGVLSLNLSVRSCDDSACSGESFSETLTNASGIPLNESITPINRYFQYRATLNTEDVDYTPVLYNVTINYTTLATDSFGNYNFTFNAPSGAGTYPIKVNATWDGTIPGENSVDLVVQEPDTTFPIVNTSLNESLTNIRINDVINITANTTDETGLSFGQIIVNDTGANRIFNFSLSGTTGTFSQNITINVSRGNVINFTARVNDTSNNFATNDTIITVANTPPATPTILFPGNDEKLTSIPIALNVTFPADADKDAITINYYINGKLNDSTNVNTTFNASDGTYILNVSLFDTEDSSANATINFSLGVIPDPPQNLNSTMNGTNVNISWSASSGADYYTICSAKNLSASFTNCTNVTTTFYLDTNASLYVKRFYTIAAANSFGENISKDIIGKQNYTLRIKDGSTTRNLIGLYLNASYLKKAKDLLDDATNATDITRWNVTSQAAITCNDLTCPDICTSTTCNFNLLAGEAYRVNIDNNSAWTLTGLVYNKINITLIKNDTGKTGLNWIAMYGNTTLTNADKLMKNITNLADSSVSDAVSFWNSTSQRWYGWISLRGGRGRNFSIEPYRGYSVSVTESVNWTQK